ncbi:LysR family transcriptional regulator [Phenylobacterium sp.]|uniref:LysR family transcriptional regulator n=1 Tax=Phenylobacterium sp. TaxID=1871053 RepID=UPI00289AAC6C|nr:LysR family transcriptional regulator [Phenylobacterium sp.]
MDTDSLRTFLAIHRAGGFSAAAEQLNRSQPAISRRIALLENELGAPVFERTAAGVMLSQLGQVLLPHAERVLAALEDAHLAVRELREGDAGPVALAAVGTLAGAGLTRILKRFAAEAPDAALTLRTATSSQVSDLVRRGEATLGLRYFEDRSPDLQCHAMAPEELVVACAPGHRLAGRAVSGLADLAGEHWLAFPRRDEQGEVAAETISAQFLVRHVAGFRWSAVDSLTAQKRLVEAGFGISLTPASGMAEELAAGTLAVIAVEDLTAFNPVFAVQRRGGHLSAAARRLLALLTEEA